MAAARKDKRRPSLMKEENGSSEEEQDDNTNATLNEENELAFIKQEASSSMDAESHKNRTMESTIVLPSWQQSANKEQSPPFEKPTVSDVISNFVTYKYHDEMRQIMKSVAQIFLATFDELEWPTIDDYEKDAAYPEPSYPQHYERWYLFKSQYSSKEMFGVTILRILYKYIIDAIENNKEQHASRDNSIPIEKIYSKIPIFCSDLDKILSDPHSAIFSEDYVYSDDEDEGDELDTDSNKGTQLSLDQQDSQDVNASMKQQGDDEDTFILDQNQPPEVLSISDFHPLPSKETCDLFHVLCPPPSIPKRDERARQEEREGLIQFQVVENDGSKEHWIILTALKNIFQRQLPMMPKEYITRLVYDHRHASMAVVKRLAPSGFPHVVGGITYRLFKETRLIEIVFCAITASEQVKGYGSLLMSHLKDHLLHHHHPPDVVSDADHDTSLLPSINDLNHFYMMTYADNYAIGYFKKQGFTKEISLDRRRWQGFIKDYDGGTLMQCQLRKEIKYLEIHQIVKRQRLAVVARLQHHENHQMERVYEGLVHFPIKDPFDIPGVREAGLTPAMRVTHSRTHVPQNALQRVLRQLLNEAISHPASWPFQEPVNADEVADYYDVIVNPMDLKTVEEKLDRNEYSTFIAFEQDMKRIVDNCRSYNTPDTVYYKCALKLEAWFVPRSAVLKSVLNKSDL